MSQRNDNRLPVAAYTLYLWEQRRPRLRLTAPWADAGFEVVRGSRWDSVSINSLQGAGLVHLHRDFPRLAQPYQEIVQQARQAGIPIIYDLDDNLLEPPPEDLERKFYFATDALFPTLQAIVEADAVTVPTLPLQTLVQPLNANTFLLPDYLDDSIWTINPPVLREAPHPLIIGWLHDQSGVLDGFTEGLLRFLRRFGEKALLRVWGRKPPERLLSATNVDWLGGLPLDYTEYAAFVSQQECDIYVVPHGDHVHHRYQSSLRCLEISACGVPGIYQRVSPYEEIIHHGENGELALNAEDWEEALDHLAESPALRRQTAKNAQQDLRQKYLLSDNSQRWTELYENVTVGFRRSGQDRSAVTQIVNAAGQVRQWQRALELQIRERDWEVRALNVHIKRKEREASQSIEQLGGQLQRIWQSPAWRLLHAAQRSVEILAGKPKTAASQENISPSAAAPAETTETAMPASMQLPNFQIASPLPPAQSVDFLYFTSTDWASLTDQGRKLVESFIDRGSRAFCFSPASWESSRPGVRELQKGVYAIDLPSAHSGDAAGLIEAGGNTPSLRQVIELLRQEVGIHDAVCWVNDPAWAELAYLLRSAFGWKIIYSRPPQPGITEPSSILQQRADLLLSDPFDGELIHQSILGLFPTVSIIILTYNNLEITQQCLESIYAKTSYPRFEVIIVDNASTDGTPGYLRSFAASHPDMRLLLNPENRGFAAGNNQGLSAAAGEVIVFQNNDTVVTEGWLSRLVGHLRDPEIGAVGPVTNSAGNESQIAVDYSDIAGLDDFAMRYTRLHAGKTFEIRMLALFCMAARRSVLDDVGPLDERFNVGMYEDDDYSLRLRHKGYRILCAEDAYVHHWGSASFSRLAAERFNRLHAENRAKFEAKWGTQWEPHHWRMDQS